MLVAQMGNLLENLRDIHWKMLLLQYMEMVEVLLMSYQMEKFLAILRVQL